MLSALFDMEHGTNSQVLITAGGKQIELVTDEALVKSLQVMWQELGIQDLEAIF
jgi:hypothetical protein